MTMKKRNLFSLMSIYFATMAYWQVENFWINLYWDRTFHSGAFSISVMVSVTAVVGVITQIVIGALSDSSRHPAGRRRVFILYGGILGAVSMCVFPLVKLVRAPFFLVLLTGVVIDVIITFFGEWTTPTRLALVVETSEEYERGKVNALLSVAMGSGSGFIMLVYSVDYLGIVRDDWYFFIGAAWMAVGTIVCYRYVEDPPIPDNPLTFRECLGKILERDSFRESPRFYYLLALLALESFGNNVYLHFVSIYAERTLEMEQYEVGIMNLLNMLLIAVITVPMVSLSDKFGRRAVSSLSVGVGSAILTLVHVLGPTRPIILGVMLGGAAGMVTSSHLVIFTWLQDTCSKSTRGSLLAYQMVATSIPMAPASLLGGWLADTFATKAGTYSPVVFIVAALIMVVAVPGLLRVEDSIKRVPRPLARKNR